jgi:hypothetical protein
MPRDTQPAPTEVQWKAQLGIGGLGCSEVFSDEVSRCPEDAVSS